MANYPTSLDSLVRPLASSFMDDPGFEGDTIIDDLSDVAEALEAKLGAGDSTPDEKQVLAGTGDGESAWTGSPTVSGDVTAEGGVNVGSATGAGTGEIKTSGNVTAGGGVNVGSATGAATGEIKTSSHVKAGGTIYPSNQTGYGLTHGTATVGQGGTTTVATNSYGLLILVDPASGAYMLTATGPWGVASAFVNNGSQFDGSGTDTGSIWSVYVSSGVITIKNRRASGGARTVTWLYLGGS
jgi:hypothetical protein